MFNSTSKTQIKKIGKLTRLALNAHMKRWLSKSLKTLVRSRSAHGQPDSNEIRDSMADPQSNRLNIDGSERSPVVDWHTSSMNNIIENFDFSNGLHSWHFNNCHAYVASRESGSLCGITPNTGGGYAVVTKRTECWQGLEQDITRKVTAGTTYPVSAYVRVCGDLQGPTEVQATLKLEYPDFDTKYLFVGRISVSSDRWEKLEGSFSFTNTPNRVVFYLEGPPPGVDLLIDSVVISSSSCKQSEETKDPMADSQSNSLNTGGSELSPVVDLYASSMNNIIENHDFSNGVHSWHSNNCHTYVASGESSSVRGITPSTAGGYAVVTKRTECWQGLEQDITRKVTAGTTYPVSAYVRVRGDLPGPTEVQATLKLEYLDSDTKYLFVGRISVSSDRWEKLEGSFSFTNMPNRVVFYLEGPPPGVDLLVDSVVISSSSCKQSEEITRSINEDGNIIRNPFFEDSLNCWSARGCKILLHNAGHGKITLLHGRFFASATDRSHSWNGIQQDISGRVQRKLAYEVTAVVRILGNVSANVRASLWVQAPNGCEQYISIASVQASDKEWMRLHGKFMLNGIASKVVIYLEGPPMGTDILVNSLVVKRAKKLPPSPPPDIKGFRGDMVRSRGFHDTNILANHDFSRGLLSWSLNSCDGYVVSGESSLLKGVTAMTGTNYAIITNRTEAWQGLEQDITMKISAGPTYIVSAYVRVSGGQQEPAPVIATLKLEYLDSPTSYIFVGKALVSKERWEKLEGCFSLNNMPKRVMFFIEGPPPDQDLLIDSVEVHCSSPMHSSNGLLGVNIIDNSNLNHALNGWSPLGSCTLSICAGSPYVLPTVARDSLIHHEPLSGRCILATNRTETWMGPSQTITNKLKLHLTYQIAAWVRVGFGACGPQHINVALGVDDQWVNGGQVQCIDDRWHEVVGSFRIEKQPSKVIVYVQGPSPGVDLMVAGLYIFPVDRKLRFEHLKEKTDKVRKRDIVLKFPRMQGASASSVYVKVRQIKNSFPFGSCISRSNIENEEFVDFFLKNFNWAVFGNELKWYSTEPEQGKYNYRDADEMIDFCIRHGIEARGHCIFWEVEDAIQPWVRSLNQNDLTMAIQNRLTGLLSRYKGKFKHYDVNNEMLHGSFYEDRLGKDIRAYLFREAHRIDPSATLFVNDYNVEDGCDSKSTPEMYIQQILDLQERGAKVGGIGIQGHINHPVGTIVCAALDKLEILGLPVWFTELDVAASNEHVRADDLEVMLREAYAHPCVEGIMLWGFWELFMCRDHSHLVDAEGDINEAGKRFLVLKKEWMSHADGYVDANGEFRFRGYQGTYTVEITTPWNKSSQSFVVEKGETPLVLTINL